MARPSVTPGEDAGRDHENTTTTQPTGNPQGTPNYQHASSNTARRGLLVPPALSGPQEDSPTKMLTVTANTCATCCWDVPKV